MVGLFVIITWQARGVSEWLKQRVGEVELFLEDTTNEMAEALYQRAQATPGVAETEYISRERAQEIFRGGVWRGSRSFLRRGHFYQLPSGCELNRPTSTPTA